MESAHDRLIKPVLRKFRVGWPGHEYKFNNFGVGPSDPLYFGASVEIFIGSSESSGIDLFDGFICTPAWLANAYTEPQLPRDLQWVDPEADFIPGLILMRSWHRETLQQLLEKLCAESSAPTWPEAANKLARVLQWEFAYRAT